MKFILAFLPLCLSAQPGVWPYVPPSPQAATSWTFTSHNFGNSSNTNTTASGAMSCSGANFIAAVVTSFNGTPTSATVSNTSTSTWHHTNGNNLGIGGGNIGIWYTDANALSGSEVVSVTLTGGFPSVYAECFSGAPASGALDQQANNQSLTTTCQTASITPTVNGELVFAASSGNPTTPAINLSYTLTDGNAGIGGNSEGGGAAYLIQGTAGATQPTWSLSSGGYGSCEIASFKHA